MIPASARLPVKRSLSDELSRRGAVFDQDQVAISFGDPAGERMAASRLGLVDLSFAPRWGFKGPAAAAALADAGFSRPEAGNHCLRSRQGPVVAALSPSEFLIAWDGIADEGAQERLRRQVGSFDEECYFVDHFQGMFCFALLGRLREALYRRCCAVDLSDRNAPAGRVFQTRIHHVDVVILRCETADGRGYDLLLGDIATATFLWECLAAAIVGIGGAFVGFDAFRAFAADQP